MRFVIADDSPIFQQKIAQFLRHDRHEVVAIASNGADAVAACAKHRPDVAVIDWCMSGEIQGGLAAQEIVQAGTARHVIMATSVSSEKAMQPLRSLGVAFIRKPFHREQLLDVIKWTVQRADDRPPARA